MNLLKETSVKAGSYGQQADYLLDEGVLIAVHCKDCTSFVDGEVCYCRNKKGLTDIVKPYDFCSYGERRTDDA